MQAIPPITDPLYIKPGRFTNFDQFWIKKLTDERDLPFVYLCLEITFIMLPIGLCLFLPFSGAVWWLLALVYTWLNNFVFKGPFGLMMHCTSHRIFFKKKYSPWNNYIPWVLGPFFGQTPETYYYHHLGMHHAENNLEDDLSSTMHYQRDSFGDFMKYFADFMFRGLVALTNYFHKRNRHKFRNRVLRGELLFFAVCIALLFVNPAADIVLFILPFFISRFIMMLGNWTQHAFVDYDDPGNCYKNSITCINTKYNHKCWNDGYHINHHLKPALHYTDYPKHFLDNLKAFSDNKAIVFIKLHYLQIWYYLMVKNYYTLSKHLAPIHDDCIDEEKAVNFLKSRTKKMPLRGISVQSLKLANTAS